MYVFIFVKDIMLYNLINFILTTNKLTNLNYVDWKKNLDIVLTLELKWVTQEIAPSTPNEHSTQEEKNNYHSWKMMDQKTKYIILGSLYNMQQHQHVFMPTTYDILFSLHDLFGGKGMSVRQVAFKAIMNTKMSKGTLISDHIFFMIGIFNEMEILGEKINGET